jgi:2-dehydropantoate 2-reductase
VNIGIIGVGGVGGYFGGKICRQAQAEQNSVYFIARGNHLQAIKKRGLQITTSDEGQWTCHPSLATDRIEDLPSLDICLLCVKSYDLPSITKLVADKISDSTIIVPLLNGVDIYDRIRETISTGFVYPSCVYVGTHIESSGKIRQDGGACKILIGQDPIKPGEPPRSLLDLFLRSTIRYEWCSDVYLEIWGKFIFIASFGLVSACFNKTLGEIISSQELSNTVISVMKETYRLAIAKGVNLQESIIGESYNKGRNFPYETKTSFQRDFEIMDRPDERDLFGGAIIRMGKKFGIETPFTGQLWDKINHQKPLLAGE